jgi:hypothetical protein
VVLQPVFAAAVRVMAQVSLSAPALGRILAEKSARD